MNKFRILTTDNEWVYSQVNVLEDRIVCPILNDKGAQFLKPNIKFRPGTLGEYTGFKEYFPEEKEIYEGDILDGEVVRWDQQSGVWRVGYIWLEDNLRKGKEKIIGNIHQNPELVTNCNRLEEKELIGNPEQLEEEE